MPKKPKTNVTSKVALGLAKVIRGVRDQIKDLKARDARDSKQLKDYLRTQVKREDNTSTQQWDDFEAKLTFVDKEVFDQDAALDVLATLTKKKQAQYTVTSTNADLIAEAYDNGDITLEQMQSTFTVKPEERLTVAPLDG